MVKQNSLRKYSAQTIILVQYGPQPKAIAGRLNRDLPGLFHRAYGCTLTGFVNRQRISHSLPQRTTKTVQAVAAGCGIQDVNNFIGLFKKQTGFPPWGVVEPREAERD